MYVRQFIANQGLFRVGAILQYLNNLLAVYNPVMLCFLVVFFPMFHYMCAVREPDFI